ncbi:mechanosensitive ion channel domain-containing protein [Loktanella sp. S4079]|uniref:mechanosensitive ion channel domain-containing protein n=1 Tax=Loktanella sp. S4079 TaxID=579483 RepID=UPI0005F9BF04|nr:mechanosensitive ion channel domain-containing protein [Loktanella sp. S4079]KJZ18354.1 mechanosensitive ion channel protein MscS [Loktanella sp. S4079]
MRIFAIIVFLCSAFSTAYAQDASGTILTEDYHQQDADIAVRMREILRELGNYDDVTVQVSEGVVTLRGTTTSATEINILTPVAARIEGVVAVRNEVTETANLSQRLDPALDRFRARLDQLIIFLPLAFVALCAFVLVVLAGIGIARLRQPWDRLAPNKFIAELYRQIVRIAFVVFGIVIALDILNATALLSTILGAAGIIGLALGFAVRDTVENFIASVMLSIRQPFRPNDTVEINGDQGKVIRLTSRATILLSFDGNHIRIPNATVFGSRIINYTQNAERRFKFSIMIDRNADLGATRQLVCDTVQSLPFILSEPAADTWIEALHPAGVELIVTGWVDQTQSSIARAKGETLRQVKIAIQSAGIVIPDATQAIHIQRDSLESQLTETTQVEPVNASSEASLRKIVEAERDQEPTEDLLRDDGQKE